VESRGSITAGNITITGPDTLSIPATDPHFGILTTSPALVLQAGKTTLDNPPNAFGGGLSAGTIQVGSIITSSVIPGINAGTVLMEATNGISLTGINASWLGAVGTGNGGTITLRTTNGNLSSSTRNIVSLSRNGNAGNITLEAPNGTIEVRDVYSRANGIGNGGNIALTARDTIRTGDIATRGVNGGDIRLTSRNGGIDTTQRFNGRFDPGIISSGGTRGRGGSITVEAPTQIVMRGVSSGGTSGGGDISLTSNQIDFLAIGDSPPLVQGTGNLILQPYTPNQDIELAGSGSTVALDLSRAELEALQPGFRSITIGRSNGTGNIRVNASNFRSPVTIQAPEGAIAINDNLNAIGNASITLKAATTTLNANIATQGGDITVGNNVLLGRDITFNSNGGNITFNGAVNGNENLTLSSGTGTTLFKGIVGGTTALNLLTTDTGGTTRLNGNVTANRLVFNDPVQVASDLSLTAADMSFGSTVSGTGSNLILQPLTPRQNLTLTAAGAFQDGFRSLTIGRNNGSGSIILNGNFSFNDPVTILAPRGDGSISATGTITGFGDAAIALNANQDITTRDIITQGSSITLTSNQGGVNSGNLNSSGVSGGSITIKARTQIRTSEINSSGTPSNGGNVILDSNQDIQVVSINAQGGTNGTGGNVDITARRFFRASGTFTDQTGTTTSSSTVGGIRGGATTLRHGGGLVGTPFTVGPDYNGTNGTRGVIATERNNQIQSGVYPRRYTVGNAPSDIQLITVGQDPSGNPILPPGNPTLPVVNPTLPSVNPLLPSNPSNIRQPSTSVPTQEGQLSPQHSNLQDISNVNPPVVDIDTALNPVDEFFTHQFEVYLARSRTPIRTLSNARQLLQHVEKTTGVKPALIYIYFVPANASRANSSPTLSSSKQEDDQLELLLVTAKGEPIRKRVKVQRRQVLKVADSFRSTVTNARNQRGYFAPAQQLYRWLVTPLEQDLQAQGIENLTFIMDAGLRSLPVAALHDRHQFLVERYSVGLMPSLSLTDIRYRNIKNSQILAMGAEKFVNQKPLPAVPVELRVITKRLWKGKVFLDSAFTLENLKAQRARTPFGMIHLATHANFKPGAASHSYIQLWNSKLSFDQLLQLGWNNPPVELLVLSACRTALGDEEAELGFAGLAVQAGVKSAVASLWSVNDEGTLALMTNFYQQLRTARIKVEALQQAQIAMLKGQVKLKNGQLLMPSGAIPLPPELANLKDKPLSHPYYWSAFTFVGNPW
jgi:CHAT domain-containing protein